MNASSQTFDFRRFGLNLKRDLLSDWRSWLNRLLMIIGVTTLAMVIAMNHDNNTYYMYDAISIFKIFAMVFCALGASLFMKDMLTKGLRLNSLMSPTSELEKFLTRWVICIVGVFVCYIACYAIADLLRVGILSFFVDENCDLRLMDPFSVMLSGGFSRDFCISLILTQSVFLLGSTVWPKDSFRKTCGALIIIGVVCALIFIGIMSWISDKYVTIGYSENSFEVTVFNARWYIYTAIIVFNYAVAWFRFRESEIIHRF